MNDVFCPNCLVFIKYGQKIDSELFHIGHPITCDKCSYQFNMFEVLRFIATNIKEAETVIDESAFYIFSNWKITDGTLEEEEKVKKFMEKHMTDIFLKEIIYDCLMWGTCFIKNTIIGDEICLEIIDPSDYKIITEPRKVSHFYLGNKVKVMINYKTGEEIPKSRLFLLKLHNSPFINENLGFPKLGYWFTTWANIYLTKQALSKIPVNDPNYESFQRFLNSIIDSTQHQGIEKMDNGRHSRSYFSDSIEDEIFSWIIDRPETTMSERMRDDYVKPPEIKFLKDL